MDMYDMHGHVAPGAEGAWTTCMDMYHMHGHVAPGAEGAWTCTLIHAERLALNTYMHVQSTATGAGMCMQSDMHAHSRATGAGMCMQSDWR